MDLVYILVVCIVFAVVLYVINNFFSIDGKLKTLVNLIALILFLVWICAYSGLIFGHKVIVR